MSVNLNDKIPNNVDLSSNRKLQKALEAWQPNFLRWWMDMGPEGFQMDQIYLRTAVSVEKGGWAHFDYVKMPDYRWGIFLTPREGDRTIGFGDSYGKPSWDKVPGDVRKDLRRIIVTQADTEPASVEQQRLLGKTAPSLYDLRNLFQVNVEEGRHLWAMVHLLHEYFGTDGRDEAEELLERRSGDADSPRILDAFNKPCPDWLSFFCFAMFMDRDGKYQLASLAESGFDPLARATQFMLTEEAHHLFVGTTGIQRVVQRTAELMKQAPGEDVRALGGVPLDLIQKWIAEWFTASLDLFGGDDSSNAASYFSLGLKGRFQESHRSGKYEDHVALEGTYTYDVPKDGQFVKEDVALRRAMNTVLRDEYIRDCGKSLERWNQELEDAGLSDRLALPSDRFHRNIGLYAHQLIGFDGQFVSAEEHARQLTKYLPTDADRAYVSSLMVPVYEAGKMAGWIAPPTRGINSQPLDYAYVQFH